LLWGEFGRARVTALAPQSLGLFDYRIVLLLHLPDVDIDYQLTELVGVARAARF
jgi:hypothetical protein